MVAMLWETRRTDWSEDGVQYTLEQFQLHYFNQATAEFPCTNEYVRDMWVAAGRRTPGVENLTVWQ